MIAIDTALQDAMNAIRALRTDGARVHCITNTVAQNFTANVLLACGATPSMTVSPEEAAFFTRRADALLINLGTLSDGRKAAIRNSLDAAKAKHIPVVLDPVMCHVSPPRLEFAAVLLAGKPDIVRANGDEFQAMEKAGANALDRCLVRTGQTDRIISPCADWSVMNGHPWLSKVTAVGCAQGALMAALAVKTDNEETACLAALLWTAIAGEIAAGRSSGPGTFQAVFIDVLHTISIPELQKRARVS
jgi:hydroxyethylthiazole kinase